LRVRHPQAASLEDAYFATTMQSGPSVMSPGWTIQGAAQSPLTVPQ
jgi:hypothetical protein